MAEDRVLVPGFRGARGMTALVRERKISGGVSVGGGEVCVLGGE